MAEIYIDEDLCKGCEGCGICLYICRKKVFQIADYFTPKGIRPPQIVRGEDCTGCENCMIYCPDLAIVVER